MVYEVLHWLCATDLARCQLVCHAWRSLITESESSLWQQAYLRSWPLPSIGYGCVHDEDGDANKAEERNDDWEREDKREKRLIASLLTGTSKDTDWCKVALQRLRLDAPQWPRSTFTPPMAPLALFNRSSCRP
jgi:hypothetical protein